MKNLLKLSLFLVYVSLIFFIESKFWLILVTAVNILIAVFSNTSAKTIMKSISSFLPVIVFTFFINSIVVNVNSGIKIGVKLLLVCSITCIFSKNMRYMELANAIEKLFYSIKFIGIKPKDVSLLVCIALSFIPILKDEIYQIKNALKAKGFKINLKNSKLIYKPFFISLIKRISDIENALKSKAYQE